MRHPLMAPALFAVLVTGLAGCYGDRDPDWRHFRVEFSNQTSDEYITYDVSGYVYEAVDKDDPRERGEVGNGSRPRAVMIFAAAGPGDHDADEQGMRDWRVYSFEAYLSSSHGKEFKEFPVDAVNKCPSVDPVALKVIARDSTLGGVTYTYDFNCV